VIKMLNTRHKLTPLARGRVATTTRTTTGEEIITNEQLSPQSVFRRRANLPSPIGRGASQCRSTGVAIFQPRELISAPVSSDFTRTRRAGIKASPFLARSLAHATIHSRGAKKGVRLRGSVFREIRHIMHEFSTDFIL